MVASTLVLSVMIGNLKPESSPRESSPVPHTLHREKGEMADMMHSTMLDELHNVKTGVAATRGVMITDAKALHDDHIAAVKSERRIGYKKTLRRQSDVII